MVGALATMPSWSIVPDVGHTPNLEEPEAQAAIDRLLERVIAR